MTQERRQHDQVDQVTDGVPLAPQVGFAITARIAVVLPEERPQRATRSKMRDGIRRPAKRPSDAAQVEVEDQVFAIVEPFRVTAGCFPGCLAEGHRPAGRQKGRRVDVLDIGQHGSAHRHLERRVRVGDEKPRYHRRRIGLLERGHQRRQPARIQPYSSIGRSNHCMTRSGNRPVAPLRDVSTRFDENAQRELGRIALENGHRVIGGAAVDNDHFVGWPALFDQAVQQTAHSRPFVEHGGNDGDGYVGHRRLAKKAPPSRSLGQRPHVSHRKLGPDECRTP